MTTELYAQPETLNAGSLTIFLSSIAFFVVTLIALFKEWRLPEETTGSKWYYRLTALSLLLIALWMGANGLIGFQLWNY